MHSYTRKYRYNPQNNDANVHIEQFLPDDWYDR